MKKLLLHIGTGKTGTSTIQNFLYQHRKTLRAEHGVHYPEAGLVVNEHFGEVIHAHYRLPHWIVQRSMVQLQEVKDAISRDDSPLAILSCEDFYHRLTAPDITFVKEFFGDCDISIVCYVRRQDKYMESAWKQQVKVGAMRSPFEDFLARHTDPSCLDEVHANYHRMLRPWADVFGVQKISLRVFDAAVWPQRDLICDFIAACSLGTEGAAITTLPRPHLTNSALPSEMMRLLCSINRANLVQRSDQERMVDWLHGLRAFNNPPLLSREERGAILRNYARSNEELFQELWGRPVPPCFTEAALPKSAGTPSASPRPKLESTATRTLIAAWQAHGSSSAAHSAPAARTDSQGVHWRNGPRDHSVGRGSIFGSRTIAQEGGYSVPLVPTPLRSVLRKAWSYVGLSTMPPRGYIPAAPARGNLTRAETDAADLAVAAPAAKAEVVGKPWPPQVAQPLGFGVDTKPAEVVRLILDSQKRGQAMSVIRLGDGESAVIGYPEFTPDDEFEHFLRIFFGSNQLTDAQKRDFVNLVRKAVSAADVVGVVGGSKVTKFTIVRHFLAHFGLVRPGTPMTVLALHRSLQEEGLYRVLLGNQHEVGLVTCRNVEALLKNEFAIRQITTYSIPEEAAHAVGKRVARHYPERCEELQRTLKVPRPGMLFLVGAGPLGKVYCQWIKERGGIALDVGSMFDAWAGLATRKYMKSATGTLDPQYMLPSQQKA